MAAAVGLTRAEARRVAVRAQRLDLPQPTGVLETVRALGLLALDPVAAVAPSAELVLWSRIGSAYDPRGLRDLVDRLEVVEIEGVLRPAEDVELLRPEMAAWRGEVPGALKPWQEGVLRWVEDNRGFRLDLLERLRADGPLPLRELPDTAVRPWRSSGWNNDKNVQQMLAQLVRRGEVAVAGREGRERLFDLAERVYPPVDEELPLDEAQRRRDAARLAALGIARARAADQQGEPLGVVDAGVEAVVEGVRGRWRVDPAALAAVRDGSAGRAALLSPLDRLVYDRRRMADLFAFEYALEMYKPAARRRWGYYALPVLVGDRLVGKLDAAAERGAGVLRVHALHEDEPLAPAERAAVEAEVADLGAWLGLDVRRDA